MTSEQIKSSIAPCGLSCEKCFAHVDGDIRKHSLALKDSLGNFHTYAQRFETQLKNPVFKHYPAFMEMLDYFARENCKGCRREHCKLFKACGVRDCHQKRKIDFCYQCDAFPCSNTNFGKEQYKAWVRINLSIQKRGLDQFYEKSRTRSRYP
ncbi:MAG: DUF3795 domain-containing protein [Desulfobacteraceae bacterium]|jgi:hypothetical protein